MGDVTLYQLHHFNFSLLVTSLPAAFTITHRVTKAAAIKRHTFVVSVSYRKGLVRLILSIGNDRDKLRRTHGVFHLFIHAVHLATHSRDLDHMHRDPGGRRIRYNEVYTSACCNIMVHVATQ
jgi:hypothetical protein